MTPFTPTRKFRNFLLDKRFQLKYTLAVVALSTIISVALGYFLYQAHREVYESQRENSKLLSLDDPELDRVLQSLLADEDLRNRQDRKVLLYLVLSLGGLVLSLTVLGIVATHKIAGPAYSMRRTLSAIADGQLPKVRGLRRGDELRAVALELKRMTETLREREQRELDQLETVAAAIRGQPGTPSQILAPLEAILHEKAARLSEEGAASEN